MRNQNNNFLINLGHKIKENRVTIFNFILATFVFTLTYLLCSIASVGAVSTPYETFATYLGNRNVACKISSTNENYNFYNFFNYADDAAGKEIKNNSESFVVSTKTESYTPIAFQIQNNRSIIPNFVFQYTTWQIEKYDYGFKTISDEPLRSLDKNEMYIGEDLAINISNNLGVDVTSLENFQINVVINGSEYIWTIIGVISNISETTVGLVIDSNCVICNYSNNNIFKNETYYFFLYGEKLSKNYAITYIEKSIKQLNKKNELSSSYYIIGENGIIYNNTLNSKKENIFDFFEAKNNLWFLLILIIPVVIITSAILILKIYFMSNGVVLFSTICSPIIASVVFFTGFSISINELYITFINIYTPLFFGIALFLTLVVYLMNKAMTKHSKIKWTKIYINC